jgi:hypothetical protein
MGALKPFVGPALHPRFSIHFHRHRIAALTKDPGPTISAQGPGGRHLRRSMSSTMSVAAAGQPLVKPKKGPKSRVAANPVM